MVIKVQRQERTSGVYYAAGINKKRNGKVFTIKKFKNNFINQWHSISALKLLCSIFVIQILITSVNGVDLSSSSDKHEFEFINAKLRHFGNLSKIESHRRKFRSTSSLSSLPINNVTNNDLSASSYVTSDIYSLRIHGFRIEFSEKEAEIGVTPKVLSNSLVTLRIFGEGISDNTMIAFTEKSSEYGGSCQFPVAGPFSVVNSSVAHTRTALFEVSIPKGGADLYICAKSDNNTNDNVTSVKPLIHQGSEPWLRLSSYEPLLPIWLSICIIAFCLCFSALFSGLNLGLMSLDRTELKILRNTGTDKEREYARKIQPVRDHGNYLLCSILLGNVLVNSTFTILLDSLTSGLIAVIFSTLAIVIFGEITPQAICSRHGLAVGAKTIYITKAIMVITFPLSYPTSKFLDYILGEEIGNVYNRERLKELVRVTTGINDLDKDEVNIISGALELRKKTVSEVMTHIEDAFMLSLDAILDFETVSEIMKSGFSRIPVYDGDRRNIVTLLYIKDLAFVDPDDNTPLKTLCEFYQNPCHFIFEDTTLDIMFKQFKSGQTGHMAFVHRVNNEGEGDPFYETIGLVTLEDVIEELIQAEIVDETDVFTDNRTKIRRQKCKRQDFTIFAERKENQRIRISPQLTLATFQYLSTTIDAFKPNVVSETILRRLLNQDIIHHIKCKGKEKDDPSIYIYQQGKPVDFFVLILEGRVEVTVGKENLVFESGPFTFFGIQALVQNVGIDSPNQAQPMGSLQSLNMDAMLRHTFVPDYSVRAVTDVIYMVVKRNLYLAAKRASLLQRTQKVPGTSDSEVIDDEVEKLLHSLDEDDVRVQVHSSNPSPDNTNPNTTKYLNKTGSNSSSPTFKSEIVPNGPTPISPNSNVASFNQQQSVGSHASNSLIPTPNLSSPVTSPVGNTSPTVVYTSNNNPASSSSSNNNTVEIRNQVINIKDDSARTPLLSESKS